MTDTTTAARLEAAGLTDEQKGDLIALCNLYEVDSLRTYAIAFSFDGPEQPVLDFHGYALNGDDRPYLACLDQHNPEDHRVVLTEHECHPATVVHRRTVSHELPAWWAPEGYQRRTPAS